MIKITPALLGLALAAGLANPGSAATAQVDDALRFWEGRTESTSTVKIAMKKPYRSQAVGRGRIRPDGVLDLVQRVQEEGQAKERRWQIRQVGKGRYQGTMSEAKGPVTIEEVGGKFRFRFRMAGGIAVEQLLTPLPGGRSAASRVTIKKLGVTVGRSEGTVRKVS